MGVEREERPETGLEPGTFVSKTLRLGLWDACSTSCAAQRPISFNLIQFNMDGRMNGRMFM